ncbi:hypothetical protein ACH4E7_41265 [Kitasatospora sp. NPDC018058]|uniref:hypothetical protein n=1 Tax=Kitasatospora sp. NPDC018058 TaxID=3364025 RepID=UPI0037BE8F8C
MKRSITAVAMAAGLGLGTLAAATVTATPAFAADSCPWPYVCFEDGNGNILTMYRDQGWQNTSSLTRSASYVTDARNDDCAQLKYSTGYIDTIHPGNEWTLHAPVVAINILSGC